MKKILVVGCGISQAPTYTSAKKLGYTTIGTDGNPNSYAHEMPDIFEEVDIRDPKAVLKIAKKHNIDGIVVPGTDFPVTGAYVAEKMGLPGIPIGVAETCSNKLKMRKVLEKSGFNVPSFQAITINHTAEISGKVIKIDENIGKDYPVVVKPLSSMAARGVRSVNNVNELYQAIQKAYLFDKRIIIEKFESGMEFSLDSLVQDGEIFTFAFADRHFMLYPYFIEIGHTMPTILDDWLVKEITEEYEKAVKALGITNGAAKGDIKLTERGIVIGEIAARISGGFLSGWTTPYTAIKEYHSYHPHDDLVRIHMGEQVVFPCIKNNGFSAERTILSIPGIVKEIIVPQHTPAKLIHMHIKEGDEVYFPVNNTNRCGSVLSWSIERNDSINEARRITKKIFIRLAPNQLKTDAFLNNEKFKMFVPGEKEEDWHGMDIQDALQQVIEITGRDDFLKNKLFWEAFYTGGAQGGVYFCDTFK